MTRLLADLALMLATSAAAQTPATVVSVYDGDTFTADVDIWPGLTWQGGVRVDGVDIPEIRGGCDTEKQLALDAREHARTLLERGGVTLHDVRRGKYAGRVVARVILSDGTDLADALIEAGLGRPYEGGKREGWCVVP